MLTNPSSLLQIIQEYYMDRKLKVPTSTDAVLWAITELGEAAEQLLAQSGGWVRNNPADHPDYTPQRFAEELGDAVMMLYVAGWASGVDVEKALVQKMSRKLAKHD